jgi:hypothetical protein
VPGPAIIFMRENRQKKRALICVWVGIDPWKNHEDENFRKPSMRAVNHNHPRGWH